MNVVDLDYIEAFPAKSAELIFCFNNNIRASAILHQKMAKSMKNITIHYIR